MKSLGPIRVDIPEDWEDRSMYAFVAPAERALAGMSPKADLFQSNVVLTFAKVDANATIDARAALAKKRVEASQPGAAITLSNGPRPESRLLKYQARAGGDAPVQQLQYVVLLAGGIEATVTFTTSMNATAERVRSFEAIVASISADV